MIHKITYCFVCAEEEEAISENEAEDPAIAGEEAVTEDEAEATVEKQAEDSVKPEDIGVKGSEVKDALALEKSFAGGNGTKSDPYIVNTAALLNEVRNYSGSYFIQTSNIDMSSISNWVPIGKDDAHPFYGHYDGNGYTISNLKIKNDGSEQYIGLFGYSGPEIGCGGLNIIGFVITFTRGGKWSMIKLLFIHLPVMKSYHIPHWTATIGPPSTSGVVCPQVWTNYPRGLFPPLQ